MNNEDLKDLKVYSLADSISILSTTQFIVEGIIERPSLTIVYGAPGDLKTFLLQDLSVCVAGGVEWLPPKQTSSYIKARKTRQHSTLWIDYDMGLKRVTERFQGLVNARDLAKDIPLKFCSTNNPKLDFSLLADVEKLNRVIEKHDAKFVVIDNLTAIRGKTDENSADMGNIMANLRRVSVLHDAAIIIIHHPSKANHSGRVGNSLRGHSSIEASLDLAFLAKRDRNDVVSLIPTKVRGLTIHPICAEFSCQNDPDTYQITKAMFYGLPISTKVKDNDIKAIIGEILDSNPMITQTALREKTKAILRKVGDVRIREVIKKMESSGLVEVTQGNNKNSKLYSAPLNQQQEESGSDKTTTTDGDERRRSGRSRNRIESRSEQEYF